MAKTGIVRLLYNHNPFYLISACVVLYGIKSTLADHHDSESVWYLSSILAGLTVVMAVTAWLIVKLGRVWDDARSILMVLVLLFFAISISFDQLCITNPQTACLILGFGFLFCVLVSEAVIRCLAIRFPVLFRIPYYLILLLIFVFPLCFAAMGTWSLNHDSHWILLSFPVLTAGAILTLIPAIRAGSSYVSENGTPWSWPLFPWSVFVLLLIGICGRCALLCIAFEPSKGLSSIFGSYMLAPIFLAVVVLLLEISIAEKLMKLQRWVMFLAVFVLPLSMTWSANRSYSSFLTELTTTAGSPLWISSSLLIVYYAVAWLRGADRHAVWLSFSLCFAVSCSPLSNRLFENSLSVWPVFGLFAFMFLIGLRELHSRNFLVATVYASIGSGLFAYQNGYQVSSVLVALHVLLLGMALIGVADKDLLARQINAIAAGLMIAFGFAAAVAGIIEIADELCIFAELVFLISVAFFSFRAKFDLLMAYSCLLTSLTGAAFAMHYSLHGLVAAEQEKLYRFMVVAATCFGIGVFISLLKGGLSSILKRELMRTIISFKKRFVMVEKPVGPS